MKRILLIKNGVCDVDISLYRIIHSIYENIKMDIIKSCELIKIMEATDCLFYDAIIICGGQQSLTDRHNDNYPHAYLNKLIEYTKIWIEANMCILGICLGAQIIGAACGFKIDSLSTPVIGYQKDIRLHCSTDNFQNNQTTVPSKSKENKENRALLDESFTEYFPFLMCCHYDFVQMNSPTTNKKIHNNISDNKFKIDANLHFKNDNTIIVIPYAFSINNAYAVQFHPEINDDLLYQIKYFYPLLENEIPFVIANRDNIHAATMKFFSKWINLYL